MIKRRFIREGGLLKIHAKKGGLVERGALIELLRYLILRPVTGTHTSTARPGAGK